MNDKRWQFWLDVGGTFTDCIARCPAGRLLRHKVLSSGVTKGHVAASPDSTRLVDPARCGDPEEFWQAYELTLLDRRGEIVCRRRVAGFSRDTGELRLDQPLERPPDPNQPYELTAGEEAPILAIRYLLGLGQDKPLPAVDIRLGTTRGTNALITRRGAPTALVTTRGFADVLRIGYQNRPHLFRLDIRKPAPLYSTVSEVDQRISAAGEILQELDPVQVRGLLQDLKREGIESLAICLLHAYCQPRHEELIEQIAREVGFKEISCSSRVAPLIKIVSRGDTTVVDAYLNPVLRSYVTRLRGSLEESDSSELRLLTSAGGLVDADHFVGKDSILSGPAGGVVGFSRVARAAGFDRAIGFDMGGTSTDVSRFDGEYEMQFETEKAGVRVVAPMLAIETVAAGGGSICDFDGVKLVVGPSSAGAEPGPACYGRGGPLAVTDVNLFLGRILPQYFPFPLDRDATERKLRHLCQRIAATTAVQYDPVELADGFLRVANANMSKAIRSISVAKGYDPREYLLVAFGGAAPQHACAVAHELGMRKILIHPDASVLSAYGIGLADIRRHRVAGVYRLYQDVSPAEFEQLFGSLERAAREEVELEGVARAAVETVRSLDLRYRGLDAYLTVSQPPDGNYEQAFAETHRRLYGYVHEHRSLEVVAARVEAIGRTSTRLSSSHGAVARYPASRQFAPAHFAGRAVATTVYQRSELQPGDRFAGPALVFEPMTTTIVEPGWETEVLSQGELLLSFGETETSTKAKAEKPGGGQEVPARKRHQRSDAAAVEPDPIMLEIFNNQFAGIAEQMGIVLRNTASSVNVKERLDFSCAIFTPAGDLVVNAPHIPVHLGAMSETVKCIIRDNADMQPGDVYLTNDPFRGGSHLPDLTAVTPVFSEEGRLLFFTASRAHHAEIGGLTPGSMPPFSRNLAEEGILIRAFKVVESGQARMDLLRQLLEQGPYPSRAVEDNLSDVAAQIAANNRGAGDLRTLIARFGLGVVTAYMQHIQRAAETKMRAALARLPDGEHRFVDHLDDGTPIAVSITVRADSAIIDFAGTGPVSAGNLNANRAIVTAAVMYCLRSMIDEDIPLNQGVLAPIELLLPAGLLNPPAEVEPARCAAVVGGNVETSQRVVDVLLGALGLAAASQGTMNNLLFGDATFGYYETICGGAGATRHSPGADAVHTHMTNTRLTDPEVLEQRFPVRLLEFAVRRGSGGAGRHPGGDGVVRRLEFLRPLEVSILSQRRGPYPPYGLDGGQPAALGRNSLRRADGQTETLGGQAQFTVQAGDVLTIETPGGGGWGNAGEGS